MPILYNDTIKSSGILGTQMYAYHPESGSILYGGSLKGIASSAFGILKDYFLPIIKNIANDPKTKQEITQLAKDGIVAGTTTLRAKLNAIKNKTEPTPGIEHSNSNSRLDPNTNSYVPGSKKEAARLRIEQALAGKGLKRF